MVRTRLDRTHSKELEIKLQECERRKKHFIDYLQKVKDHYLDYKISYSDYEKILHEKRNGKSIKEWIEYYDEQIKEHKKRIHHHKKRKVRTHISSALLISLLIVILFFYITKTSPSFTGKTIEIDKGQIQSPTEFTEDLNLETNQSTTFDWNIKNQGFLQSLKISGSFENQNVKIYLDDLLILDSSKSQRSFLTGNVISQSSGNSSVSYSEKEQNESQKNESNLTIQTSSAPPENLTENTSVEQNTSIQEETRKTTTQFTDVCEETCDLSRLNLNKSSYKIRIESNSQVKITNIKYALIQINKVPEENTTQQPPKNLTIPEQNISTQDLNQETSTENQITINQPVKWKKKVSSNRVRELNITLPQQADKIIVRKVEGNKKTEVKITSKKVKKQNQNSEREFTQVETQEQAKEYEIEYETPAPTTKEEEIPGTLKRVIVSAPDELNYTNVATFTNIPEKVKLGNEKLLKVHWIESDSFISFNVSDTNNNGLIDRIDWVTPHLSNQTFDIIIEISKAEHLDGNHQFLSDIYENVSILDNRWSETITDQHYVRVTFEKSLTKDRDITLFPRIVSGTPVIKVYEKDSKEIVAQFENIQSNQYNKVYLTNLISESQDTFDLKITGGSVEIDYIVDPATTISLVPNAATYPAQNGTHTDTGGFSIQTQSLTTSATTQVGALNISDAKTFFPGNPGNTVDTFVIVNFSLPAYENLTRIFVTTQINSTGAGATKGMGLFNYTSGLWQRVNSSLGGVGVLNITTYNITFTSNSTSDFVSGGKFRLSAYLNTTANADNIGIDLMQANVTYLADTFAPNVNITFPSNNTNTSITTLAINYTVNDTNLQTCWWTNSSGRTNQTLSPCGTNISGVTWLQGINNITIYSNDTSNNVNTTSIKFTLDSIAPNINITFPLNNTNPASTTVEINYTVNDSNNGLGLNTCWWTNSSGLFNTSITCGNNITARTWFEGINNITVYANDSAGNVNSSSIIFTTPSSNTAPLIYKVFNDTLTGVSITENSFSNVIINFSVFDADGAATLSNGLANITMAGESTRLNQSCKKVDSSGNYANYSCTVQIWYFDNAGAWTIRLGVNDSSNSVATNYTSNFSLGQTTAFTAFPGNLTFASISPSGTNTTSNNDPLILNNTGNKDINNTGITINVTDLIGETDSAKGLYAGNFSWSNNTGSSIECNGTQMQKSTFVAISNTARNITANLSRGNHSLNDGVTAYENLYLCLNYAGPEINSQAYSTLSQGPWTIKILAVIITLRKKKKLKEDKLSKALKLITEEIKNDYSKNKEEIIKLILKELVSKHRIKREQIFEIIDQKQNIEIPISIFQKDLGALETLVKYMKENLAMRYSEIAKHLNRDERTVWTSYNKSLKKFKGTLIIENSKLKVSLKELNNSKYTILESLILFLKSKDLSFKEISLLIKRDQRNIWTIYSNVVRKNRSKV